MSSGTTRKGAARRWLARPARGPFATIWWRHLTSLLRPVPNVPNPERLQDWREGGPQTRFELDSRTGPFDYLVSSGISHDNPRIDAKAAGDERLACNERVEAWLDHIGRWVEGWVGVGELQDRYVEPLRPV